MNARHGKIRSISLACGVLLFAAPLWWLPGSSAGAPQDDDARNAAQANPFLSATGKVVVPIFVRTDCPIANRYAPK